MILSKIAAKKAIDRDRGQLLSALYLRAAVLIARGVNGYCAFIKDIYFAFFPVIFV